jgi:hypothetical protein
MSITRHMRRSLLYLILIGQTGFVFAGDATVRLNFLLNFGRFTEWESDVLAPGTPIRYCFVTGDAELSKEAYTLEKQQIQGHAIKVALVTRSSEVAGCHALFLPSEMSAPVVPFLKAAETAGALTVSDVPGIVDQGAMIELVLIGGRYRFDVNLLAVKRAGLYLSSNMLKLARTVK